MTFQSTTFTAPLAAAILAVAVGACTESDVCEQAADHLEECLGQAAVPTEQCDQAKAESVLEQSCEQLKGSKSDLADYLCEVFGIFCDDDALCCDIADQPGFNGNPSCSEGFTCCADGTWECNNLLGHSLCEEDGQMCEVETCGGLFPATCSDPDMVCVDDPSDSCDPDDGGADCTGVCVVASEPEATCCDLADQPGANGNPSCSEGFTCCADGTWECNNLLGHSLCEEDGEICSAETCGGLFPATCSDPDMICVDDPSDSCDPDNGGADCTGICIYE